MRKVILIVFVLSILTACTGATRTPPASIATATASMPVPQLEPITPTSVPPVASLTPPPPADFFVQMGISVPAPTCSGLTQSQTEGPYYKADSPERNSLLAEGMQGTHLILVGYVLDRDCQPVPGAWLDFWQADAGGEYDNTGYRLRGHQFTDAQGRYYLETILPGLYASRPIEHIHVKVQLPGGEEVTSQLYFSEQPVEGLTVFVEDRGDYQLGYFNFVLQR